MKEKEKELTLFEYMVVRILSHIEDRECDNTAVMILTILLSIIRRNDDVSADFSANLSLSLISAFRRSPLLGSIIHDYEQLND